MNDIWMLVEQGGWPMIVLGLCSVAAVTVIVERGFALRWNRVFDARVLQALDTYDGEASAAQALMACERGRGAFARLAEEMLKARHLPHSQAIEIMHASGRTQVHGLERGLTLLEIVAGISPLLGLLGTVLGMVTVFNAITVAGIGNPQVLSEGISQALVTTVAGLCIAIPALAAHSWFTRRVEAYAAEMHDRATGFIARLYAGRG